MDGLEILQVPLVQTMDKSNTQHRAILRSFFYQDKRRHAFKYAISRQPVCPELKEIQLRLTILIANSLISDTLSYIRRNQRNSIELAHHLLNGCQEMRKISVFLTLPLTDEEEEHVTNFLKQSQKYQSPGSFSSLHPTLQISRCYPILPMSYSGSI